MANRTEFVRGRYLIPWNVLLLSLLDVHVHSAEAGTKVGLDQLRSLTLDRHKKKIRPQEITLALISKLTLVKLAQMSYSFGVKTCFSFNPS